MKNILITGAGGFIGSHLAERCVQKNYNVKSFVRYNSKNNWGWLERSVLADDMEIIAGDIRDYDSVLNAAQGCDTIFHLAALIGIPYSYVSPLAYIKTNIEGTYNVLQAARTLNIDHILITSTSETYGTAQYVPIDEKHPLVGQSPYSASKIAADQLAMSFHRSFSLPVTIIRPFNTYGPRQSARAIIPTIISQLLNKRQKLKLGNLSPTRDLTFVKDTVEAFLEIAKNLTLLGQVINIGQNREISINDLVGIISDLMNTPVEIKIDEARVRAEKSEVERLLCDNSKILKMTDWLPKYTLRNGLIQTIDWLRKHEMLYKDNIYNI